MTPMMQQYNKLKKQFSDCILLFRLGDFYEGFNDDAKILSKVLGITLTGRGKTENRIPMAGIPYHALQKYLPKLIKAGHKVAIGEQMEDAVQGQLVERDVTKVITAGTILDENILEESSNNYLAAVYKYKYKKHFVWAISYADISTGEFKVFEHLSNNEDLPREIITELFRIKPVELITPRFLYNQVKRIYKKNIQVVEDIEFSLTESTRILETELNVTSLKGFGIDKMTAGIISAGALYRYLLDTQRTKLNHITKIAILSNKEYMILDQSTITNLELIYPIQMLEGGKTLFEVLNKCATPMGQRTLKNWILRPLVNVQKILRRQSIVQDFIDDTKTQSEITTLLSEIPDLERVLARVGTRSANARDFLYLKSGVDDSLKILKIINKLQFSSVERLKVSDKLIEKLQINVVNLLNNAILEDPAITITEGNIIKANFDVNLSKIKEEELKGKEYIKRLQETEIKATGITSLKVRFNKVFGYYIEVSKSNIDKVPESYIRKQTLVNAERYITEDLKKWEDKVLGAESKAAELEYKIFERIRNELLNSISDIQKIITIIAEIDVLTNFAYISKRYKYVKPEVIEDEIITEIIDGRHPVVESIITEEFIPNDLQFKEDTQETIILTGPNMSGKSTFIRQNALIFLMAQIGCFVPATRAKIGVVDRIFTRVGASDNLATGESTFMVEMNETANILNNATNKSLLILDEVGRGTSTYDGVAIAWAVVEYIANHLNARTLFATHYHELIGLEDRYQNIKNFNVEVREIDDKVLFMRKIIEGGTDKSYGIHVAEIAGLPEKVISRASEILIGLEEEQDNQILVKQKNQSTQKLRLAGVESMATQLTFGVIEKDDGLKKELDKLDIDLLTPLDALVKLKQLKDKSQK